MLLLLACAHTPHAAARVAPAAAPAAPAAAPAAPAAAPAAPAPSAEEAIAPRPCTREQLVAAFPAGTVVRLRIDVVGRPSVVQRWEFLDPTAEGVTIAAQVYDPAGTLLQDEGKGTSTWAELHDHAAFPAAATTITAERIDTPMGPLDTHRYTVLEGPLTKRFWFADQLPGPPVLYTQEQDGAEIFRMTMIERR